MASSSDAAPEGSGRGRQDNEEFDLWGRVVRALVEPKDATVPGPGSRRWGIRTGGNRGNEETPARMVENSLFGAYPSTPLLPVSCRFSKDGAEPARRGWSWDPPTLPRPLLCPRPKGGRGDENVASGRSEGDGAGEGAPILGAPRLWRRAARVR